MADIHLYGIPNCDTVKKARSWLTTQRLDYVFHDYKKEGVDPARLAIWANIAGWAVLLNRRGTTFRALSDTDKADIDQAKALRLMVEHTSLIKRPIAEHSNKLLVGFKEAEWASVLQGK